MMRFSITAAAAAAAAVLIPSVLCAAPTDEYRDADQLQSGYLTNHNMDPSIVDSAGFGQLWRVFTGGADTTAGDGGGDEGFLAKPLVYTTLKGSYGSKQVVIACSETNWIYVLDAVNGTIYNKRQLHRPALASDLGCTDVNPQIGITGTPVIDPGTDIMYLYAKTYFGNANGYQNMVYYFHAIDVNTLADAYPPVNINGGPATNDPNKNIYFTGNTVLQRTSLSLINGAVWAGFGGHCDLFNYTGWVVGIDASTGNVFERFATEVGTFAPPQDGTNNYKAGGGGAGIWQSGMGLTSDGNRLFFVTGNDYARANVEQAASGRAYMGTLGQAVVNLAIDPTTRQLSLTDYFEPYEYIAMDGGDRDLGSSGLTALDPTVFKGTNVAHIGVTVGKNGKAYIVNMDNLGGFKNGPGGGDLVLQTIAMPGGQPVFGGVGSYPLEGGYIYLTPVGYPTQVYKFVPDANGNPSFTLVSQTSDSGAGRVGAGVPVVTSYNGIPDTAILWITDPDAGMRAYYAVPQPDGSMKKINMPAAPAIHKYQRPAFGDGRIYLGCVDGHIICLGSPVALPFTCSAPINFGPVTLGSTATLLINCTANIPVTKIVGLTFTNPLFTASNSSLPTGSLTSGQKFSFPATFDLRAASVQNTANTSYSSVKPGVASGSITLITVNGVTGYSTKQPLPVTGTTVSKTGFLSISPGEVDFGGLVINSVAAQAGSPGSMIISNIGVASLTITGSSWSNPHAVNSPITNVTQIGSTGQYTVGPAFNATNWPQTGYTIQGGSSVSVSLNFRGNSVGTFGSVITIWSTGGNSQSIVLAGTMSTAPVATLMVNNGPSGAFQSSVTGTTIDPTDGSTIIQVGVNFGNLSPGQSSTYILRMSNTGGSSLLITKSKPPEGVELTSANPSEDLPEGGQIAPNSHADAVVIFTPNPALSLINSDPRSVNGTWTLNTDDLNFGVHVVTFTGNVVVPQHGPLNAAGHSIYKYLGCFQDTANGGPRLLAQETDNAANNENGLCQNQAHSAGAVFAGTEYHTQCWYGNAIPSSAFYYPDTADHCTWTCPADSTQPCGGDGGYMSIFYDSTKYDPSTGICTGCTGSTTPPNGGGGGVGGGGSGSPVIEKTVGSYSYIGCYTEATSMRALSSASFVSNTMSPDSCAASCTGYSYFGVEYSSECYCGNSLNSGSVIAPNGDSECNMPCAGNSSEYCGAGNRLTLYHLGAGLSSAITTSTISSSLTSSASSATTKPSGPANKATVGPYNYYGCQTESTAGRALSGAAYSYDAMTVESCAVNCTSFSYFGVEYGRECYCGNSLNAGSVAAPATDCSFPCNGDGTELCGAGNRLSLYAKGIVVTTTTTANKPASPSPTAPTIPQTIGSATYYGCMTEASGVRALSGATYLSSTMTLEMCIADCGGFTYAGVEYGQECYCGNSFNTGSVAAPGGNADCNMLCPGNKFEYCGAGNRLSVYKLSSNALSITSSSSALPSPTGPVHVMSVGSYNWQGCYTEASGSRALNSASLVNATGMTVEMCAKFCTPTYPMFGVEYSAECYCGATLQAGSVLAAISDCSMTCSGSSLEYCGAGNRLDVYK